MLRSASRILGYRVIARDGQVGRCVDLLLDPGTWQTRYLVVDAGTRVPGGRVLISPVSLRKLEWTSRRWVLDGTRAELESEPASAPALQSLEQLIGFCLDDSEGYVGYVEDVIVDDDSWHCRQLLINAEFGLSGQHALVPTEWLAAVQPDEHRIEAPVPRARIASALQPQPGAPFGSLHRAESSAEPNSSPSPDSALPAAGRAHAPRAWAQALAWKERSARVLHAALHRTLHGR